MRRSLTLLSLLLLPLQSWGQQKADAVVEDEFPALQFMPVGTVLEGISIPRYEKHRVTALLLAKSMTVQDRKTVVLKELVASLYGDDGNQTDVTTESVTYSFATKTARTTGEATVNDPRFTGKGQGVIFNTSTRKGFLHGPVQTTVSAATLNQTKGSSRP